MTATSAALIPKTTPPKLSLDNMVAQVRRTWEKDLKPYDKKRANSLSTRDVALSCLSIFLFKLPSLLQYDADRHDQKKRENLQALLGLDGLPPSDTQMRTRLDGVAPQSLRRAFKVLFAVAQRAKLLESYTFMKDHYLISLDGTGHFSSETVHCAHCCETHHKNGSVTYAHQMMGASLVHPSHRQVFPLAPEPILKSDGDKKNDCERNASKRFLRDLRREHPHLKIVILEDGLASNGPHLKLLQELDMRYIIGAKPGDHQLLFSWFEAAEKTTHTIREPNGTKHDFAFVLGAPLNDANFDLRVNFLHYTETSKKGQVQKFSWVTDLPITRENVYEIMRGGRARWKIENETFNTLKNQGYNFEHNYGHGQESLCTNMGMMMLLGFLINQIEEAGCQVFKALRKKAGTYRALWEKLRVVIELFTWGSWDKLYEFLLNPSGVNTT